jgi:hypothetical protein
MPSSRMLGSVAPERTDVSEENIAYIIRVKTIRELACNSLHRGSVASYC